MEKILIVEDEFEISNVLKDYFENEDFEVEISNDGPCALKKFEIFKPDLIILDIMLPYLNGIELCRIFREKSKIPIIMLSAKTDEKDKILTLELGADEYIEKPFSPKMVLAQSKALLRRYKNYESNHSINNQKTETIIEYDHILINTDSRIVKIKNNIISFTPKEYELLLFLMKNPNKVFTKSNLLEIIWGTDEYIDPNTITVHIKKIREKIEVDSKNHTFIKTAWGIGYQFSMISK